MRAGRFCAWVACSLLLALGTLPAGAAARERVAVLEFRNQAGIPQEELEYLTDVIVRGTVRELLPSRDYMLMTRESITTLLEDRGIRLEQVCEGACEVDVGRKIGAHLIVTGSVWKVGPSLEVTVKLFDTRSGDLLSQKTVSGKGAYLMREPLVRALGELAASVGAGAPTPAAPGAAVPAPAAPPLFAPSDRRPASPGETGVTEVAPTSLPAAASGPAGLFITSDPPGAEVYLGAVRAGIASPAFQKTDLQAGTRLRVTLRKPDYRDKSFDVDLKPGITKFEGVKLQPAYGTLAIESAPPGASVTIGGEAVGRTPYRNERTASGQHLVSVDLDLHRPVLNQVVEVNDGGTTRKVYTLEPDAGTLSVDSEPRGATVKVAGRDRGRTPLEIQLRPDRYEVALELAGHRSRGFEVTVVRGKKVQIQAAQARLEKRAFTLNVFAEPPVPGARIFLDGQDTGKQAPDALTGIPEGARVVEVRTPTQAGKAEVTGRDGETRSVTVALREAGKRAAAEAAREKAVAEAVEVAAEPGNVWIEPHTGMELVWVPGGCYSMGCGGWTSDCYDDEKPVHEVCVDGFWMGRTEVTQRQWKKVMNTNPSHSKGSVLRIVKKEIDYPVDQVSWQDAKAFAARLASLHEGRYTFRLPTEAEWEFACRSGGKPEKFSGGNTVNDRAWYYANSGGGTQQVATKAPNGLGLHDMSGSVWEWCEDGYDDKAYSTHRKANPLFAGGGKNRVARGGSWFDNARSTRCGKRLGHASDQRLSILGFRLVRNP